ncbi:glutathione S-transferase family protein [Wolbachia endosymbiont of Folsomia candida]|uniref:glutathione S-transferase family protein n=1 Tax=Wolbachia endosymbiont of Folsomia candida TaxID=169402 RepID=UPI000AD7F715|nr:glutathione S-transferase family protein [Wolbachia endosymbiont of Folsomia candida]APR98313.1 glutathione S-transferase family protein [Wolbachia endosymbiont of Folsomia candida]
MILYHFPLCPFSRKVRALLKEKKLNCDLVYENPWEKRDEFMEVNPTGQVPVLVDNSSIITDSNAICEYLEEMYYSDVKLLGSSVTIKSKVRALINWFDNKFYNEVTKYIMNEKVIINRSPDSRFLHAAQHNLSCHIEYIEHLINENVWLATDKFTLADITLASHISVMDYVNSFPWEKSEIIKEWYSIVKSRPCFREILSDRVSGLVPPKHYIELDF